MTKHWCKRTQESFVAASDKICSKLNIQIKKLSVPSLPDSRKWYIENVQKRNNEEHNSKIQVVMRHYYFRWSYIITEYYTSFHLSPPFFLLIPYKISILSHGLFMYQPALYQLYMRLTTKETEAITYRENEIQTLTTKQLFTWICSWILL